VSWVHITDATAAKTLRPTFPAEAFTVQVSVPASMSGLPAREKAIDAAMAGFKAKSTDTPTPFDVPAAAYRKMAETVSRSVFVGEVRVPAKAFADFVGKVQSFGNQSAAKAGVYASLRDTGTASVFPSFAAPKDRVKVYDLSKGVRTLASQVRGAAFTSRLAHLWDEDPGFLRRMGLLRDLKLQVDTAHVMQPLLSP
jgi:hypothetical protein